MLTSALQARRVLLYAHRASVSAPATSPAEREFLSQLPLIERIVASVARQHRLPAAEAEDFASIVKLKLIEDDYRILREFQGRARLRTFLTVVVQRQLLDYRNSTLGKWRPSAEARRSGRAAELLEQCLIRDGHTFDEACAILTTNHGIALGRAQLEALAAGLPSRARRRFEPEASLVNVASPEPSADALLAAGEQEASMRRLDAALQRACATLDAEDRAILALRFRDGRKVAEVAVVLGLPAKPLYARVERLKIRLRALLEAEGFDAATAREALGADG